MQHLKSKGHALNHYIMHSLLDSLSLKIYTVFLQIKRGYNRFNNTVKTRPL